MKKIGMKSDKRNSQKQSRNDPSASQENEETNNVDNQLLSNKPMQKLKSKSKNKSHSKNCIISTNIQSCACVDISPVSTDPAMVGLQSLDIEDHPATFSDETFNNLHSPCEGNYLDALTENIDSRAQNNHRKKEKLGIFRNIRKHISALRRTNSECVSHSDTSNSSHLGLNKHKETDKVIPNSKSVLNTPSTNDRVHSSLKYMSPKKFNEFHSNTDHSDPGALSDKPGCVSKDISRFNSDSSEYYHSLTSDQRSMKAAFDRIGPSVGLTCDKLTNKAREVCEPRWTLPQELDRLSKFGWYWGPITKNEAEARLINQPDGAFLVRDSSDERYLLSLSFRSYGHTFHTRIEHCNGMFSFYAQPDIKGCPSIVDLIEHSMNDSPSEIFYYSRSHSPGAPEFPVRLTKPMSRFLHVRSLQYLCRFVIRQYTRYDHIQQLPLPTTLKGWIEENQY